MWAAEDHPIHVALKDATAKGPTLFFAEVGIPARGIQELAFHNAA